LSCLGCDLLPSLPDGGNLIRQLHLAEKRLEGSKQRDNRLVEGRELTLSKISALLSCYSLSHHLWGWTQSLELSRRSEDCAAVLVVRDAPASV
jgi:hypothetical protein